VATTKSYWAGFEDEAVKKVTGKLLDFGDEESPIGET
jgi:hypothetical protein